MIFRNRLKNPQPLFFLAMLCIVLSNLLPRFLQTHVHAGENWTDGLRGLFLGLAIGLLFLAAKLKVRQRSGD